MTGAHERESTFFHEVLVILDKRVCNVYWVPEY